MASPRNSGKGAVGELHIWASRAGLGLGGYSLLVHTSGLLCFLWFDDKVFLGDADTHTYELRANRQNTYGVDVSKFSEVDIKMDGVLGSGIVHFIWKFKI